MKIAFEVGGRQVEFHRHWFTGHTRFAIDGARRTLEDGFEVRTHFNTSIVQSWKLTMFGHEVEVKKTRPALFAGFRPQHYVVSVDGTQVVERTGF